MPDFTGSGSPLTPAGFTTARKMSDIDDATLWSILAVETAGCGYLPDRRPQILFERHVFSRLTGARFDADHPDISAPTSGAHGEGGAHQYSRLEEALSLDENAALRSASWGLGQIMGNNFKSAGFANVDDMVAAMVGSEDEQLKAVSAFITANRMDQALRDRDWAGFASRYNGPNFADNNYDTKLETFHDKYSTGGTPDLLVRAVQVHLMYKRFAPGTIDGVAGPRTIAAVKAFQISAGDVPDGIIDDALLADLAKD